MYSLIPSVYAASGGESDPKRLKGRMQDFWAVTVQANWRITFRFEDGDVHVVDYVDYH